jgi:hypothetical protein
VRWREDRKKWIVELENHGERLHLGFFSDKHEAALARDEAAKQLHGDFANLNFIYRPLSKLTDGLPPVAEL